MFKLVLVAATLVATVATARADSDATDERECPAEVRGVSIASSVTRGGVAFTFRAANPRQLPALRSLLREAAAIIEHQSRLAALHPEVMPTSDGDGAVSALDIAVKDTPTGAIVTVRPEERAFIWTLQRNARELERFWSTHACVSTPMMAQAAPRALGRR